MNTYTITEYSQFLFSLIESSLVFEKEPEKIYLLLDYNIHLLDYNFLNLFCSYTDKMIKECKPDKKLPLGESFYHLAYLFYYFRHGNRLINLAISNQSCKLYLHNCFSEGL